MLTIRRDPDLMQKRKEKVSAEIALSYLTYYLRRAMNILGVGVLVARIRERNRKNKG